MNPIYCTLLLITLVTLMIKMKLKIDISAGVTLIIYQTVFIIRTYNSFSNNGFDVYNFLISATC